MANFRHVRIPSREPRVQEVHSIVLGFQLQKILCILSRHQQLFRTFKGIKDKIPCFFEVKVSHHYNRGVFWTVVVPNVLLDFFQVDITQRLVTSDGRTSIRMSFRIQLRTNDFHCRRYSSIFIPHSKFITGNLRFSNHILLCHPFYTILHSKGFKSHQWNQGISWSNRHIVRPVNTRRSVNRSTHLTDQVPVFDPTMICTKSQMLQHVCDTVNAFLIILRPTINHRCNRDHRLRLFRLKHNSKSTWESIIRNI